MRSPVWRAPSPAPPFPSCVGPSPHPVRACRSRRRSMESAQGIAPASERIPYVVGPRPARPYVRRPGRRGLLFFAVSASTIAHTISSLLRSAMPRCSWFCGCRRYSTLSVRPAPATLARSVRATVSGGQWRPRIHPSRSRGKKHVLRVTLPFSGRPPCSCQNTPSPRTASAESASAAQGSTSSCQAYPEISPARSRVSLAA